MVSEPVLIFILNQPFIGAAGIVSPPLFFCLQLALTLAGAGHS